MPDWFSFRISFFVLQKAQQMALSAVK